jgi:hypothetical protein
MLSKNETANEIIKAKIANEPKLIENQSISNHLLLTKSELDKSLSIVLKDTEKIIKK